MPGWLLGKRRVGALRQRALAPAASTLGGGSAGRAGSEEGSDVVEGGGPVEFTSSHSSKTSQHHVLKVVLAQSLGFYIRGVVSPLQ